MLALLLAANVLIINADDTGRLTGPNVQRLAALGVNFKQHDAQPLCSVSRAALLTGRQPERMTGIGGAIPLTQDRGLAAVELTIADHFHNAGYITWLIGKWHLGWIQAAFRPLQHGFDFASWIEASTDSNTLNWWEQDAQTEAHPKTNLPDYKAFLASLTLKAQVSGEARIANRDAETPYFLYLAPSAAHVPYACYAKQTGESVRNCALRELDQLIGDVVDTALAADPNTIVVITSDNGDNEDTTDLAGKKGSYFEGGLRTTLVVLAPGLTPRMVNCPVMSLDILPTVLSLAGLPIPTNLDGMDLTGLATGVGSRGSDVFYWTGAYREGDLKVTNWNQSAKATLYDLGIDPGETTPVNNPTLKAAMIARAKVLRSSY